MRRMLPKIFLLFLPDFVQGECAHSLAQSHYSNMTRSKTNMRDCAAAFALARVIESLSPSNLSSHRSPSIPEIKRERRKRMEGEFEGRWKR